MKIVHEFIDTNKKNIPSVNLYLIGSAGLLLSEQSKKEAHDVDIFIDAKRVELKRVKNVDLFFIEQFLVKNDYTSRAIFLEEYKGFNIYALNIKDIILTKIAVYHFEKYRRSIEDDLFGIDINTINEMLVEIENKDFGIARNRIFIRNINWFRKLHKLPYKIIPYETVLQEQADRKYFGKTIGDL